jgi:hypothetical protein
MASQHQIHPSNDNRYRPTPSLDSCRQPSDGQLATYQTGPNKFPNLAAHGGFLLWSLSGLYEGVTIDPQDFNCISWAVGHTDRWIEPSSDEKMTELCKLTKREHLSGMCIWLTPIPSPALSLCKMPV